MSKTWPLLLTSALLLFSRQISAEQTTENLLPSIYEQGVEKHPNLEKETPDKKVMPSETCAYIKFLVEFIKEAEVLSIVDVSDNDGIFSKYVKWGKGKHTEIDVVKSILEKNQNEFGSPTVSIVRADALDSDLPSADLIVCKDVLQHLPTKEIKLFLEQLGKFKHCLITNDVDAKTLSGTNREVKHGDYRTLDLTKPPFRVKGVKIFTYNIDGVIKQVLYIRNPD